MKRFFQSKVIFSISAISVVILLIFLHYFNLTKPLDIAISWFLNPITSTFYDLGASAQRNLEQSDNLEQLQEENQLLQDQVNNLLVKNSQLYNQLDALQEVKEQIAFIEEKDFQSVSVQVIGLSTIADNDTYIINKGSNQGLAEGYPVIIGKGILIGKISEVEPLIAKFVLITDSQQKISAEIQNENNSTGLVEGELGISLKMTLIPQDDPVELEQTVITSGLDLNIPRGLLIGSIKKMTTQTGELFQSASLVPYAQLARINIVSVITPDYD